MPKRTKKTDLPPTIEELDKGLEENLKKLEEDENKEEDSEKTPEDTEETQDETPEAEPEEEEQEEQDTEESKEEETEPEENPEPDEEKETLKKRYSDSSREALKLNAKNKKLNQAVSEASELKPPTDKEMEEELGDDWGLMSDLEKRLARDNTLNNKRFALVQKSAHDAEQIEAWNDEVRDFVEDPKTLNEYPALEGKTDDFQEFASDEKNNGIPFEMLVGYYLHKNQSSPKKKGKMMETSTGSSQAPTRKAGHISFEEGESLRTTNFVEYKRMLMAGRIDEPKL